MLSIDSKANRDYAFQAVAFLQRATYQQALVIYSEMINDPNVDSQVLAYVGLYDRYFFAQMILRIGDTQPRSWHPWLYERCREVEAATDGYIDLWAREHFKSTYITFAGALQEVARNPELTIGIFSHNAKHSRGNFIVRIKTELETNKLLPLYYPYAFFINPQRESPVWSRNDGLVCKRKSNPPEATFSGHGLVDGQPIGSHFGLLIYDDVVTDKSVGTPEMIIKTTDMWDLSQFLGQETEEGVKPRVWYIGTRYNHADTYKTILERKVAIPRIYPATDDGTPTGEPIFLTKDQWETKKERSSRYMVACQMLQNPMAGDELEFKPEYIRRYEVRPHILNAAILADPASSKKTGSSDTAFTVIGMDAQYNKYFLDGAVHKMNLTQKWEMLKSLHKKWSRMPGIQSVQTAYEKYAHQSDIEHFETMMKIEKYSFHIEAVNWPRDTTEGSKRDRIRRLLPDHQNWRFFYPYVGPVTSLQQRYVASGEAHLVAKPVVRKNHDGRLYNVVDYIVNSEMAFFPALVKMDGLDSMSRFYDLHISPPIIYDDTQVYPEYAGAD